MADDSAGLGPGEAGGLGDCHISSRRARKARKKKNISPVVLEKVDASPVAPITMTTESQPIAGETSDMLDDIAEATVHVASRKRTKRKKAQVDNSSLHTPVIVPSEVDCAGQSEASVCREEEEDSASMLAGIPQELIDSIHLPFDDEPSQPSRPRTKASKAKRRSRRSMDFSLPPTTLRVSPETAQTTVAPSAERCIASKRRRRTADFDVISTILSPESPDLEEVPFSLPAPRRSRRLKRQSIELYRSSLANQEPDCSVIANQDSSPDCSVIANQDSSPDCSVIANQVSSTVCYQEPDTFSTPIAEAMQSTTIDCDVWPSTSGENQSSLDTAMILDNTLAADTTALSESAILDTSAAGILDTAMEKMCLDSSARSPGLSLLDDSVLDDTTSVLDTAVAEQPPRRARRKSSSFTADAADTASAQPLEKPAKKGTKRKREVSVEDVYLNRLWKSEMDRFPSLETIHEEPSKDKLGREAVFGGKKLKRFVNYEDFNSQPRLKRRRKKAMKSGWKPLSKKQHEVSDQMIREKIGQLEAEIAALASHGDKMAAPAFGDPRPAVEAPSDSEDMYYTPYKAACNVATTSDTTAAACLDDGVDTLGYQSNQLVAQALPPMEEEEEEEEEEQFQTPMKYGTLNEDISPPPEFSPVY